MRWRQPASPWDRSERTCRYRSPVLGPGKLLVVALSVITDTADREAARAKARDAASASLGRSWFAATITRLGYTGQQIATVSDELVCALVPAETRSRSRQRWRRIMPLARTT